MRADLASEEHRQWWDEVAGAMGAAPEAYTDGATVRFFGPTEYGGPMFDGM